MLRSELVPGTVFESTSVSRFRYLLGDKIGRRSWSYTVYGRPTEYTIDTAALLRDTVHAIDIGVL